MYRIERKICTPKPSLWITDFLMMVSPSVYECVESPDDCQRKLNSIQEAFKKTICHWHQKNIPLKKVAAVVRTADGLAVVTPKGHKSIKFTITIS